MYALMAQWAVGGLPTILLVERKPETPVKKLDPTKVAMTTKGISAPITAKVSKRAASKPTSTDVTPPKPGCTIYIGRLPHGFQEEELNGYFSQFGQVTRLRLSRNAKTGASKHYAFLEFQHAEVARIVAETMNNYLLFGHLVQSRVVPEGQLHKETFKGANRKFAKIPWAKIAAKKFNARREGQSEEDKAKEEAEGAKRIEKLKEKCAAVGIEYDFSSVVKTRIE